MFQVLPIKLLREEDREDFGEELVRLAKLSHLGLPVEEGLVVASPDQEIKEIALFLGIDGKNSFEGSKQKFKERLLNIAIPEELKTGLINKGINDNEIWKGLLENWYKEIESKIFREEFNLKKLRLLPKPIFFAENILASGKAFYNFKQKEVVVKMDQGELGYEMGAILDTLIVKAHHKLHLPFIYSFIIDSSGVKFVNLTPLTSEDTFKAVQQREIVFSRGVKTKRVVKLFLEVGEGFITEEDIDGFLVGADKGEVKDRQFKYAEVSSSHQEAPSLYECREIALKEPMSFIDQLREDVDVFLYARNKQNLLNTQFVLPKITSLAQFLQIKRDLLALGVSRKGSLKLWLQVSVLKNLLEIEEYLREGVDGVIINLDIIGKSLLGEEPSGIDDGLRNSLIKFIEEPLRIIRKLQIPFLVKGKMAIDDQILGELVRLGMSGVVLNSEELKQIRERLKSLELLSLKSLD